MEINKGDIIICSPGFYGSPDKNEKHSPKEEPNYGGAGYVDGLMIVAESNFDTMSGAGMIVRSDFNQSYGVFGKAIRRASPVEAHAYSLGVRNINEIKISEMSNVKITLNSGIYIEPAYVPFEKNDVCVCLPGFTTEDVKSNDIGAGSGYKENFIFKIYRTSNKKLHSSEKYLQIHWPADTWPADTWPADTGNGIYERGIRRATLEEENAFYAGITNLNDIPTKKLFKISYVSTSGEIKKEEVFAFIESEAVATLKDLKSINYIMSDSSITERDFYPHRSL